MKQIRKIWSLAVGAALIASCQDPDYPAPVISTTVRSVTVNFINAAPDAPSPGSFLVNNAESASIAFPGSAVVSINPSSEQFRIKNAIYKVIAPDTVAQSDDLISQTTLAGNGAYTVILTDTVKRPFTKGTGYVATIGTAGTSATRGGLTFVQITDNLTAPASGNAGVRFLNLAPGAAAVYLTAGGANLPGTLSTSSRSYKTTTNFTAFTSVPAGSYNLEVRTGSVTGTIIATLPSTALADGKLYTIFLSGKAVKIGSTTKVKVPYAIKVAAQN